MKKIYSILIGMVMLLNCIPAFADTYTEQQKAVSNVTIVSTSSAGTTLGFKWKNPAEAQLTDTALYTEAGEKVSGTYSADKGAMNYVGITGLTTGQRYSYNIVNTFDDGSVEKIAVSAVPTQAENSYVRFCDDYWISIRPVQDNNLGVNLTDLMIDTSEHRTGDASMHIDLNCSKNGYAAFYLDKGFTYEKDATYKIGMWYKATDGLNKNYNLITAALNVDNGKYQTTFSDAASEWTNVEKEFTNAGSAATVEVLAQVGLADIWVDDVYVCKKLDEDTWSENLLSADEASFEKYTAASDLEYSVQNYNGKSTVSASDLGTNRGINVYDENGSLIAKTQGSDTVDIDSLDNGKTYNVKVTTVNHDGLESAGTQMTLAPAVPTYTDAQKALDKVTIVAASNAGTTLGFKWKNPAEARLTDTALYTEAGEKVTTAVYSTDLNGWNYVGITGLTTGQRYSYNIVNTFDDGSVEKIAVSAVPTQAAHSVIRFCDNHWESIRPTSKNSIGNVNLNDLNIDLNEHHTGNASMHIDANFNLPGYVSIYQNGIGLNTGKKYKIGMYYKTNGSVGNGILTSALNNYNGAYQATFTASSDWKYVEKAYTLNHTGISGLQILLENGLTDIWIDDVCILEEQDDGTWKNLLQDAGFETYTVPGELASADITTGYNTATITSTGSSGRVNVYEKLGDSEVLRASFIGDVGRIENITRGEHTYILKNINSDGIESAGIEKTVNLKDFEVGSAKFEKTDENGNVTGSISKVEDGYIKATVEVRNRFVTDGAPVTVVAALYDGNGRLVNSAYISKTVAQSELADELGVTLKAENTDSGYKMKVFAWKSLESMNPYAGVSILE